MPVKLTIYLFRKKLAYTWLLVASPIMKTFFFQTAFVLSSGIVQRQMS